MREVARYNPLDPSSRPLDPSSTGRRSMCQARGSQAGDGAKAAWALLQAKAGAGGVPEVVVCIEDNEEWAHGAYAFKEMEELMDNGWGPALATHHIDNEEGGGEMMQVVPTPTLPLTTRTAGRCSTVPFVRLRVFQIREDFKDQERICTAVRPPQGRLLRRQGAPAGVDLLVTGVEASLWLAEQWAGDLKLVFPQLNVQAVSANKVGGRAGLWSRLMATIEPGDEGLENPAEAQAPMNIGLMFFRRGWGWGLSGADRWGPGGRACTQRGTRHTDPVARVHPDNKRVFMGYNDTLAVGELPVVVGFWPALRVAAVTNRSVIIPKLACYCDKYWTDLDKCRVP
ncbi:hypothetical protein HYH03_019096, partial [Edaphochlamys debaryana]